MQNYQEPGGTQDVDDDHQMTWLRQEDGQTVIDVYRKSDRKYDRWAITNCEGSTPIPGGQCGVAGGGCVSRFEIEFLCDGDGLLMCWCRMLRRFCSRRRGRRGWSAFVWGKKSSGRAVILGLELLKFSASWRKSVCRYHLRSCDVFKHEMKSILTTIPRARGWLEFKREDYQSPEVGSCTFSWN